MNLALTANRATPFCRTSELSHSRRPNATANTAMPMVPGPLTCTIGAVVGCSDFVGRSSKHHVHVTSAFFAPRTRSRTTRHSYLLPSHSSSNSPVFLFGSVTWQIKKSIISRPDHASKSISLACNPAEKEAIVCGGLGSSRNAVAPMATASATIPINCTQSSLQSISSH